MPKLTHIDLFSGIGGFALAADWTWGKENIDHVFCEIEPFAQKVLNKHWPDAPIHSDIKEFNYDGSTPFILTGGFPCQPFSVAGKQRGKEDDRALWPEMLRVIQETRPRWIIGENVIGFVNMELDNCLSDLDSAGYDCQPLDIPAAALDAKHLRHRVWILCHARHDATSTAEVSKGDETRTGSDSTRTKEASKFKGSSSIEKISSDTNSKRGCSRNPKRENAETTRESSRHQRDNAGRVAEWSPEPQVGRVANGLSDRACELKGLGNAIVPQVAQAIMQCIKQIEEE